MKVLMLGGSEYLIQPLYVGDLARAVAASLDNPKTYGEIYCISGPDTIRNRDYFTLLGELLGLPVEIRESDEEEYRSNHSDGYLYFLPRVYDLGKLREAGLPVPRVGLREGLKEQVEWLVEQGR